MKKIILDCVFLLSIVSSSTASHAANLHPPTGVWGFCTTASQIGCIKKATVTAPGAEAVVVTNSEQLTATGVTLRVECGIPVETGGAAAIECSSDLPTTGCTAMARPGGLPELTITLSAQTYPTKFQVELATGDYKPRFGMGIGTQKIKIAPNGDGTYIYSLDTIIDIIPMAGKSPIPIVPGPEYLAKYSEWISTATADMHFIKAKMSASATIHGSCDLNFDGLWLDFNSQGFSLGGLTGGPVGCDTTQSPTPCTATTSLVLRLKALSPHYKEQESGKELELNPARIVVYVPNKLLAAMGFSDPATFDAKSLSVTTKDGQITTPTLERDAEGVLVNLGVQHYSEPDPVVTISRKVAAAATPAITNSVIAATPTLLLNRSKSPSNIASLAKVSIPKGAALTLKVSPAYAKNCKVVGTSVKAIAVGTCKVTLTVKPKTGKATTKVVTLTVKK